MICGSGGSAPRFHTLSVLPTVSATSGVEAERQALVAARVVVRADEFVAGEADQHRARDHLELPAADAVAERAVADVGQRERPVAVPETAGRPGPASHRKSTTEIGPLCRVVAVTIVGHRRASSLRQQELRRIWAQRGQPMKTHTTTLLTFGALATSLLLAGCGQQSKPAPAAAAATPPPAPPPPTLYDAEAFFATTSYIMPRGLCLVCRRQAAARQLGRNRHLQSVRVAGRRRRQAAADVVDSRFDVRRVMVSRLTGECCSRRTRAATRSTTCSCAKRTATTRDLTPGDKAKAEFLGWSADKQHFFVTTNERNAQAFDLYRYATKDYARTLRVQERSRPGSISEISPDGRYLALVKPRTSADSDVYLVDLAREEAHAAADHASTKAT